MCIVPEASVVLSIPTLTSMVFRAEPAMLLISLCRNELRAEFIVKLPVLPSARYIPVVSIPTASLPRSSGDMVASSPLMVLSSGASMVNCTPIFLRVWVMETPQLKSTLRFCPPSPVMGAFTCSVAVMFSLGFMGSPVNST